MPDIPTHHSSNDHITSVTPSEPTQGLSLSLQYGTPVSITSDTKTLPGTVEHLLALQPPLPLDEEAPEVVQRLVLLRREMTHLLTRWRLRTISIEEAADLAASSIQVGPFHQWQQLLLSTLYEIDRAGNLLPLWHHLIERGDPSQQASQSDPTTDPQGYARRVSILLLGYYKQPLPLQRHQVGFASRFQRQQPDLVCYLGTLLLDPTTSLYASQALASIGTQQALEELLRALPEAQGWSRIDILERCLALNKEVLYTVLLTYGLEQLHGLEIYAAHAFYRSLPLEKLLTQRLHAAQAALILHRMFLGSEAPPQIGQPLPLLFERPFPDYANTLFQGARQHATWQAALALHVLGLLLGRYWQAISQGTLLDNTITAQIYSCLPMMPEIEQWMHEIGHNLLVSALDAQQSALHPFISRALNERQEPHALDTVAIPR